MKRNSEATRRYLSTMTDDDIVSTLSDINTLVRMGYADQSTVVALERELQQRMDDHLATFFKL